MHQRCACEYVTGWVSGRVRVEVGMCNIMGAGVFEMNSQAGRLYLFHMCGSVDGGGVGVGVSDCEGSGDNSRDRGQS